MSLINDALKQARQDASAGDGRNTTVPTGLSSMPGRLDDARATPVIKPTTGTGVMVAAVLFLVAMLLAVGAGLVYFVILKRPLNGGAAPTAAASALPPTPAAAPGPSGATGAGSGPAIAGLAPATSTQAPAPTTSFGKARRQAQEVAERVRAGHREGEDEANTIDAAPGQAPAAVKARPAVAAAPPPPVPPPSAPPVAVAPPKGKYTLNGIMGRAPDFMALINGRLVKAGDSFDDTTIVRVEAERVVFKNAAGREFVLKFLAP